MADIHPIPPRRITGLGRVRWVGWKHHLVRITPSYLFISLLYWLRTAIVLKNSTLNIAKRYAYMHNLYVRQLN